MAQDAKMRLYSLVVFNTKIEGSPVVLASAFDVSDFGWFQQSGVREFLMFASRECIHRTQPGMRQSVLYQEHLCHVHVAQSGLGVAVISDESYPQRVAFGLGSHALREFVALEETSGWADQRADMSYKSASSMAELLLQKYKDPNEADKLAKIQKDLDDTKEVLVQTMDKLLDRGERLDTLAAKSEDLSFQSKVFLDQSASLNSCCTIL
jgi:synaptobrevin homolog YKT6